MKKHLENDPAANPLSRTNTKMPLKKEDTICIERVERAAHLFVRSEWWMEGKMRNKIFWAHQF